MSTDENLPTVKEAKNLFAFMWKYISIQRGSFITIYLLTLIWAIDATVNPYLIGQIVDAFTEYDAQRESAWPIIKWLFLYMISLWILVEVFFRIRDFMKAKAFPQLEADIRMGMFDHIQHHTPTYFNQHFSGSLANKISDMTTQVSLILHHLLLFIPSVFICLLSVVFFFAINPLFAGVLAVWIIVHFSICLAFTNKCAAYSNIHAEARSSLAGKIVDSLTNNFAVNLFSSFRHELKRISLSQRTEKDTNYKAMRYVALMFTYLSIVFILGATLLNGLIVLYWMQYKITTGEIIQIFNTTWNLMLAIWFASELIPQFFQSIGIATQALTVMNDPKDVIDAPDARPLKVGKGEIVFDNVTFHYGAKRLFNNKHVHIKGGEKIGLVGFSGAGKSTFVQLILRFYPLEKGKILIDRQNIADATLESLHRQVTLIPQDPMLFHRTLEENIAYGRPDASKEEIIEAAKFAHCEEFILKSAQGYATLVGERGTKLSGGERQRIAIARAMLTNAPILILDEATSALDSVTESYIQESLEKLMQNRTTLVIAHRLSTLAKMDRILVFDEGRIVEQGSHAQLIAKKKGHYAQLWQLQAGGFLPDDTDTDINS